MNQLILASSSIYRRRLLERLGIPFSVVSPDVDESEIHAQHYAPKLMAQVLAKQKASGIFERHRDCVVIGADQIVASDGEVFHQPRTKEQALVQLLRLSGRAHSLFSAVCVLAKDRVFEWCDETRVKLRELTQQEVEWYLQRENALDCAGGYKIEGLGISLIESIVTPDPSSVEGLGLIKLSGVLKELGLLFR